jgi:glycerate 2-kinase
MSQSPHTDEVEFLMKLYRTMLDAADPLKILPAFIPKAPSGKTIVVGMGKAAASMAKALETHWNGPLSGVVVVPKGASLNLTQIKICEGSHPIPDASSVAAAHELMQSVSGLSADDLVIALVSGGGSAICALPIDGLSLEDKQFITQTLLKAGATISEINTVRRHLSAIKGGRLAVAAYPARVITLLISDIPGDDPALIASGPTLADSTTCTDALSILERYGVKELKHVKEALESGVWESIKPDDARLANNEFQIVATSRHGLNAVAKVATDAGWPCHILSDSMEGEARDLAKAHAAIALSVAQNGTPFKAPCVIISGGEATVTLRGKGQGGRNTEFALAFAIATENQIGAERIHAVSAGTDGLDGRAQAAGAWVSSSILQRARMKGLNPQSYLDTNDSATLLDVAGALIKTGPTYTNINDFRAIFVGAS